MKKIIHKFTHFFTWGPYLPRTRQTFKQTFSIPKFTAEHLTEKIIRTYMYSMFSVWCILYSRYLQSSNLQMLQHLTDVIL